MWYMMAMSCNVCHVRVWAPRERKGISATDMAWPFLLLWLLWPCFYICRREHFSNLKWHECILRCHQFNLVPVKKSWWPARTKAIAKSLGRRTGQGTMETLAPHSSSEGTTIGISTWDTRQWTLSAALVTDLCSWLSPLYPCAPKGSEP